MVAAEEQFNLTLPNFNIEEASNSQREHHHQRWRSRPRYRKRREYHTSDSLTSLSTIDSRSPSPPPRRRGRSSKRERGERSSSYSPMSIPDFSRRASTYPVEVRPVAANHSHRHINRTHTMPEHLMSEHRAMNMTNGNYRPPCRHMHSPRPPASGLNNEPEFWWEALPRGVTLSPEPSPLEKLKEVAVPLKKIKREATVKLGDLKQGAAPRLESLKRRAAGDVKPKQPRGRASEKGDISDTQSERHRNRSRPSISTGRRNWSDAAISKLSERLWKPVASQA
ncbi:hypothetical protein M501DRAFT_989011 [Patellaria atrata CBS 101060]|uniref:Uncharacterized protein n=1 Tax=Patellaria atrata CBS 101060 TaxID=1346257 RepID=A0A9P4S381_9PEZI|nr:hypothetical protein M501DRAFT_989011 [Patellaria atrata CBS 101060]